MSDILDLRDLADEWTSILDDVDATAAELESTERYRELCRQLGIAETPDALLEYAGSEPTLIPVSYMPTYAKELCEGIDGEALSRLPDSVRNNIDWSGVANSLSVDYDEVTYAGDEYCIRSC